MNNSKLIRDLIPSIIEKSGKKCRVKILLKAEFKTAILEKLEEETQEVIAAENTEELIAELADLYEVIDAILTAYNLDKDIILKKQEEKRIMKGGFRKRYQLIEVQNNE